MKKYPSKISYGLVLFILTIFIGVSIPLASPPQWTELIIILAILAFIAYLFFNTYYIIDGSLLLIKCGFLVNKKIDINTIILISETNCFISSPAVSLDRLNINYHKDHNILISPKNKFGFIEHITGINPGIEIQYKSEKK